jgi:glyceraldehyde-3-phosphate dehydrogenase/erythrose-4-phosphate dehydrogenase
MRIGINGLGRIGRCILRNLWERNAFPCVHINELDPDIDNIAYLIKYDTVYGRFKGEVINSSGYIILRDEIKEWTIRVSSNRCILDAPWEESETECVIVSSGVQENMDDARRLINRQLRNVIITNYCNTVDYHLVFGFNDSGFTEKHRVISTDICDSIATLPVIQPEEKSFRWMRCIAHF